MLRLTPRTIEAALAIYGAAVSTFSFFLGIRAHKLAEKAHLAAGPVVSVGWEYYERTRDLVVSVINSGRSDITVYELKMKVVQQTITRSSPTGRRFADRMTTVEDIEPIRWWKGYDPNMLPVRLSSNSRFSVHVRSESIGHLPGDIPVYDILLRFSAETADDYTLCYFRGDVLRHFIGIDLEVPVRERDRSIRSRYKTSKSLAGDTNIISTLINRYKPGQSRAE